MTPRPLPRSRLGSLIPALMQSQALVALVPASDDLQWAAAAAWDVARAAVPPDRRVALVDLWLDQPRLHEVVGLPPGDGIVDAFEYGVSLNTAERPIDGVHFIAAGSYTTNTGAMLGHPRWQKLHGGFRSEGALLLLFISAGALGRLAAVPDGIVVLSPDGLDPESAAGREVHALVERGVPLLGVVRERWTPSPLAAPRAPDAAGRSRRRAARPVVVAATLAAGAAGGLGLLAHDLPHSPFAGPGLAPPAPASAVPAPAPAPLPLPAPVARADTLAWTVQLAAYGTAQKALAFADQINAKDSVGAFVTPVPLGRRTVWYRVLAGPYPTRDSATAARDALWHEGVVPQGQGDLLWAPFTLALARGADISADLDRLRRDGVPPVPRRTGEPVLVGAFESADQASLAQARLARAGVRATLIPRMDTIP